MTVVDISDAQRRSRAVVRIRCKRCGTAHRPLDVKADRCISCAAVDDKTAAEMYRNCRPQPAYGGNRRGQQ